MLTLHVWFLNKTHSTGLISYYYIMGSNDWNILALSLFLYDNYINPFFAKYGLWDALPSVTTEILNPCYNLIPSFALKTTSVAALITAFKFLLLIALLIFIRGGVPRYRYDFLTKIGWIRFLSLVIAVFLSSLLLTLVF